MARSARFVVFETPEAACRQLAAEITGLIRANDSRHRHTVLGLATGKTPLPLYQELIRLHRGDGLSFSNVASFNLDEYLGLERDHPQSYWSFMHQHLFDHINLPADHIHLPTGGAFTDEIPAHCAAYEAAIARAGGLDLQILGIGRSGHIGFNEPGTPIDSRTHLTRLDEVTRQDAAPAFGGVANVPTHAITMGCGTILAARRIALLAWGSNKADIVRKAIEEPVTDQVSASFLQTHPAATFFLDRAAAAALRE